MTSAALAAPAFPPLFRGYPVGPSVDPMAKAVAAAMTGDAEPGAIHYAERDDALHAAVTLVPEQPLEQAIGVVFAVQLGLADALGALAPPEVAVHFVWPAGLKVNGAACGGFRATASTQAASDEPDWLIVAVEVPIAETAEGGATPDRTTLQAEGCADITAPALLESWSRHMLSWIHRYLSEGMAPLHEAWRGKCDMIGSQVTDPQPGLVMGLDERGGLLLRDAETTRALPLTEILERT